MRRRVSSQVLVGREQEFAEIQAALARCLDGTGSALLVVGEAGVGKTRLVKQVAAAVGDGAQVWLGRCLPFGEGLLPYAPVVEVLRAAIADFGDDRVRELAGGAAATLACLLPEFGDGAGDGGWQDGGNQSQQWSDLVWLLNRMAAESAVIVIEDLHWADSSTRGLLDLLVRGITGRLLVVCTYRTDELPPAHPLRSLLAEWRRAGVERIELGRLDREQTLALIAAIEREAVNPMWMEELYRRSGGNPFFVEELLVAGPAAAELSENLRDVLLLRVRMLCPAARAAVSVVAIAGHTAEHALLVEVLQDIPPGELLDGLSNAVDNHILVTEADRYAFRHVLVGEAIAAAMLPGERVRLHYALAEALDRRLAHGGPLGGNRFVVLAQTAHHWFAAGDTARALVTAIEAGLAAGKVFALPEAHSHFKRALDLWPNTPQAHALAPLDLLSLYQHAAETAYLLDDMETALALIEQGMPHTDPGGDPTGAGLMHERRGRYMFASGKPTPATLEAFQTAVDLVPDTPTRERARVLVGLAGVLLGSARHEDSAGHAIRAVEIARRIGARQEEARALSMLGFGLVMLGRQEEGIAHLREALAVATAINDPVTLLNTYINLSDSLFNVGQLTAAADVALRGLDVFKEGNFNRGSYVCLLGNALESLFWLGRWDELEARREGVAEPEPHQMMHLNLWMTAAAYDTATGRDEQAGHALDRYSCVLKGAHLELAAQWSASRAEWHLWRGEAALAWQSIERALDLLGDECSHGPLVARLLADGAWACADLADASDPAMLARLRRRIADLPTGLRLTSLAEAYLVLAQAELARLENDDAAQAWSWAAKHWNGLGALYPAAYAKWREAEALLAQGGSRRSAAGMLAEAHRVTVSLGAQPLRGKIEALARRARVELGQPLAPAAGTPFGLTSREHDVLALLASGHTNRQIARRLFISEKTVGIHVSQILSKMEVPNRGAAAAKAHQFGLLQ